MKINTTEYGVCDVKVAKYQNNDNLFLSLVDAEGMPVTNISTNIMPLLDGHFAMNIHNMGKTLWEDIEKSNLFEYTGDAVDSGFCNYPIFKLVTSDVA